MALGSLVQAAASSTSLKKIIQAQLASVEDVAFLTAESWVRASSFPEICPREEVLCSIQKVGRKREVSADLALIFEHGKALHNQLQNSVLPAISLLLGNWSCLRCGAHCGRKTDEPVEQWAVPRPERCTHCEGTQFHYHECRLESREYQIQGHPDGFLRIPGLPGLGILEAKSISSKGAWEVRNVPNLNHVIQAHIYMWLAGLQWAKVLYWDKGSHGLNALVEHTIECDDETVDRIKTTLRELWAGIRTGSLPERVCADADAPRARSCAVRKPCFEV
jgi:hypothetical protein